MTHPPQYVDLKIYYERWDGSYGAVCGYWDGECWRGRIFHDELRFLAGKVLRWEKDM